MLTILTVDDSKAVHSFLQACMSGFSIKLEHAYDGKQAIEWLEKKVKFDLILLDWEMPVLTGPEVVQQLAQKKLSVPIVMLTSKNAPEQIAQMLSAGVADYIMKPFTQDILIDKIERVLGTTVRENATAA